MTHGHTRIKSKGKCIYCGRSGIKLTDEHVLPYFIGGTHILCEASCDDCAKITSKFERDVGKGLWDDGRTAYDAPSRRKKKRKKYIFLNDQFNPDSKLKIPYSEYPAPFVFYFMNEAGILKGEPKNKDTSGSWLMKAIVDETRLQAFEKKYPGQLTARFFHVPDSFARMLAKIGYGQVLCSLDPDDFVPICLPYFLGIEKNLSYIVGSSMEALEPLGGIGYSMSTHTFGDSKKMLLIAEIRLLANNHTPSYHVVVGFVEGEEEVRRVSDKVATTFAITIPDGTITTQNPATKFHWMPRIWPLPGLRDE